MIFYYLDASAWIKRYYQEAGTPWIQALFQTEDRMACATLGVVEVIATLVRKAKAREIDPSLLDRLSADVEEDWARFIQVQLTSPVLRSALMLARDLALRGADVIHLASAMMLQRHLVEDGHRVVMLTSDHELYEAARMSGMAVMDPVREETH